MRSIIGEILDTILFLLLIAQITTTRIRVSRLEAKFNNTVEKER